MKNYENMILSGKTNNNKQNNRGGNKKELHAFLQKKSSIPQGKNHEQSQNQSTNLLKKTLDLIDKNETL